MLVSLFTGGVTGGRGVSHSVLSKWVVGMSATHEICTSLEEFCGVLHTSGEQHKDIGLAIRSRNEQDVVKLCQWLDTHDPFPETRQIMSIATGMVGDDTVTCYDAHRVGSEVLAKIVDVPFSELKLTRKNRALPLSSVTLSMKIHNETITVDPMLLFQRISICKKSDEDLVEFLKYELAPFPLALFNENGMRKTAKSVLYTLFEHTKKTVTSSEHAIVVDGGFLLHKVVWQRDTTVSSICEGYIRYLQTNYPSQNQTVVFDGYSLLSTKAEEQKRRYRLKKSVDINVSTLLIPSFVSSRKISCQTPRTSIS